jgi:hypothetical protein
LSTFNQLSNYKIDGKEDEMGIYELVLGNISSQLYATTPRGITVQVSPKFQDSDLLNQYSHPAAGLARATALVAAGAPAVLVQVAKSDYHITASLEITNNVSLEFVGNGIDPLDVEGLEEPLFVMSGKSSLIGFRGYMGFFGSHILCLAILKSNQARLRLRMAWKLVTLLVLLIGALLILNLVHSLPLPRHPSHFRCQQQFFSATAYFRAQIWEKMAK